VAVKSPAEGFTGWKAKRCNGLATALVLPSMSTTWTLGAVKADGKADEPCGGWLAQSK